MSDLKSLAEKHITDINAQIEELNEEIKRRNQKQFEKIAVLEAQKAPIEKLLKDFSKQEKAEKPSK